MSDTQVETKPILRIMAELINGLEVPYSVANQIGQAHVYLGKGADAWSEAWKELHLFGYASVDEIEKALTQRVGKEIAEALQKKDS